MAINKQVNVVSYQFLFHYCSLPLTTPSFLALPLPLTSPSLPPHPSPLPLPSPLQQEHVTVAVDLRICTVKLAEDQERRFCFEVVTPTKSCMLQADSDLLRRKWLSYLEAGISRALNISASNKVSQEKSEIKKKYILILKNVNHY